MPNRIIKESICTSEEIDALTPEQEVFFYRLMVVCDDYGLMDARPAILKARCYPLKAFEIKCIQAMLEKLDSIGLIRLYLSDGKPFLQVTKWEKHQSIRAKKPKFPQPNADDFICKQAQANAPVIQSNPIQSESESESNHNAKKARREKPAGFDPKAALLSLGVSDQVATDWLALRKKKRAEVTPTVLDGFLEEAGKAGIALEQALRIACKNGWQGFEAAWINKDHGGSASRPAYKTVSDQRAEAYEILTGNKAGGYQSAPQQNGLLIEGEASYVP